MIVSLTCGCPKLSWDKVQFIVPYFVHQLMSGKCVVYFTKEYMETYLKWFHHRVKFYHRFEENPALGSLGIIVSKASCCQTLDSEPGPAAEANKWLCQTRAKSE